MRRRSRRPSFPRPQHTTAPATARKALVEPLEDRRMFSLVYAVTQAAGGGAQTNLVTFDTADPTTILSTVPVSFLTPVDPTGATPQAQQGTTSQRVVGMDIRPSDGRIFLVTRETNGTSLVYALDPSTGNATVQAPPAGDPTSTPVVVPINPPLSGTSFGVDVDPVTGQLRVISNTEQNLLINPDTGQPVGGANTATPTYGNGDPGAGANPNIAGLAFAGNFSGAPASPAYVLDTGRGVLAALDLSSAAQLSTVGSLTQDISGTSSFDILTGQFENGFIADGQNNVFYSLNVTTGQATPVGTINVAQPVVAMTLAPVTPGFSFSLPNFAVPESAGTVSVTVTRTGVGLDTATVSYAVTGGTATAGASVAAGADYFPVPSGVLVFNPGEFSKTFTVQVLEDQINEPDETVLFTLSNPSAGTVIDDTAGQLTILDNDAATILSFSAADYPVSEGAGVARITVRRTGASGGTFSVNFTTAAGTAVAGQDFSLVSGTLTFGPGETVKTFDIPIANDNVAEPTETLDLILSNPTNNAEVPQAGAVATVTIVDDDSPPVLTLAGPATALEGPAGQTTALAYTVTLTGGTTQPVTVRYSTSDGTARLGNGDYLPATGLLTFDATTSPVQTIVVSVVGDNNSEADETFSLNLFDVANATLANAQAAITIRNDDVGTRLQTDPGNPRKTLLTVTGTPGDDAISIRRAGSKSIDVFVNGVSLGVFRNPGRVAVFAGAGNDDVRIDPRLKISAELHGEDGNDVLQGGKGRDILLGGAGADQLFGAAGEDILLGNVSIHDNNSLAIGAIMREWTSSKSYTARVRSLTQGAGFNGSSVLTADTIADDNAADLLAGSAGRDFFPFAAGDNIIDGRPNETGAQPS